MIHPPSKSRLFRRIGACALARRAFTLLELLVVIVIISVLAGLGLTVAGKARLKANQAASISNLRQWYGAMEASLADSDGSLPAVGALLSGPSLDNNDAWFNRLPRYLGEKPLNDPAMLAAPPKAGSKSVWVNPAVPLSANAKYVNPPTSFLFCYALNYYLSNSDNPTTRLSRIERLAATVFMGEKGDNSPSLDPSKIKAYFGGGNVDSDPKNEANFLFCDGHVASVKREIFTASAATDGDGQAPTKPIDRSFTFVPYAGAGH